MRRAVFESFRREISSLWYSKDGFCFKMGWLVFMTCVVVWVLLDTCLMEFLLEMDFLSMTDGYSKRNCWDETWKLFDSMSVEGNVEPEEVTMIVARSTCSQKGRVFTNM